MSGGHQTLFFPGMGWGGWSVPTNIGNSLLSVLNTEFCGSVFHQHNCCVLVSRFVRRNVTTPTNLGTKNSPQKLSQELMQYCAHKCLPVKNIIVGKNVCPQNCVDKTSLFSPSHINFGNKILAIYLCPQILSAL